MSASVEAKTVRDGDVGVTFQVTIMEPDPDNVGELRVKDVSAATTIRIYFQSPIPTSLGTQRTAVFTNTGSDGKIEYVGTVSNPETGSVGRWTLEGEAILTSGTFRSTKDWYDVEEVIAVP